MKSWNDRARAVFAQGGNTYSKLATQYIEGVTPTHIDYTDHPELDQRRGHGFWSEGEFYVDYVGGLGSNMIVCRHIPPAPGCQSDADAWRLSPGSSCHVFPPSVVRNNAASSTPA